MRSCLFFVGIIFIAVAIFLGWFVPRAYFWFPNDPSNTNAVTVSIADGWSAAQVADVLQQKGIIDSAFGYRLYASLSSVANHPIAGDYPLLPHSSYVIVARTLGFGPPKNEVQITIPEGWTIADISKALAPYDATIPQTIPDELRQQYALLAALPKNASLEGYLFPDTYRVYADQLPQALIQKQLYEFAKRAPAITADAEKQGRTLQDVVILASIIEKEVAKPEDRPIVASIFLNRIKDGMPLQSDATLNYITHANRSRASSNDLKLDSPYNTYTHKGLPPGPISNPGDAALQAALHPAQTNYKYFLMDDKGTTYFAKTLAEHDANRIKAYGAGN